MTEEQRKQFDILSKALSISSLNLAEHAFNKKNKKTREKILKNTEILCQEFENLRGMMGYYEEIKS